MPSLRRIALVAVLLVATAAAAPLTANFEDPAQPPIGLGTSELSQADVLHRFVQASDARTHWKTRAARYTASENGLTGTEDDVVSGRDFVTSTTLGPLHSAKGSIGGEAWRQNENGEVVVMSDFYRRENFDDAVLRDPSAHAKDISLLGTSSVPYAYVLRVNPPQGELEYVFLDAKTFSIVRKESDVLGRRVVTVYDDFRATGGHLDSWHIVQSDGRDFNNREWTLSSVTYDAPVAPSSLAIPVTSMPVALGAVPAKVSDTIIADRVIVTANIEGHPVNLQLDSGAYTIVIDRAILDALHIDTMGNRTKTPDGKYPEGQAIVPKITFGDVTMRNVVVASIPFANMADEKTPVAGLLGFDFIDGVVLHVDYASGHVEALDPRTFVPPARATRIPIALDGGQPIASARIGRAIGTHFIVDTGADRSTVYSSFAAAHPSDLSDQGLGQAMQNAFPFTQDFMGVRGPVSFTTAQVANFSFGGSTFDRWLFTLSHNARAFEGDDADGLIGQDVLRYFDVYFDYPHQAMYLVPNQRYIDRFGT